MLKVLRVSGNTAYTDLKAKKRQKESQTRKEKAESTRVEFWIGNRKEAAVITSSEKICKKRR